MTATTNNAPPPTPRPRGPNFDTACTRAVRFANRKDRGIEGAEAFLTRAGWGGEIFGVEHVGCAGRSLAYLNTGDTYNLTIGQEGDGPCFDTSWGGWYEDAENKYCEENGVIRCGYCGEFTPVDAECWHNTICEPCGNFVDGHTEADK